MPSETSLKELMVEELKDLYNAEKQLTKALPKMAKAATSSVLRDAFETHLEETRGHIQRIEQVMEGLGEKIKGKHCDGMAGIIEEGKAVMEEDFDEAAIERRL